MSKRLVQGVGLNDGRYPACCGGKNCKEYTLWSSMLSRCYNATRLRLCPAYEGCTVSDNFKLYSYFYDWCHRQIGFYNVGWCLDKDILSKGAKQYNEDCCVFVPPEVNKFFVKPAVPRSGLPLGVFPIGDKFKATCKYKGINKYLGRFNTAEGAGRQYMDFKHSIATELAAQYKELLDPRAYNALINYTG